MDEQMLEVMRTEIAFAIKMTVNGKIDNIQRCIDAHNLSHEADMKRMMPIIEAFEQGQEDLAAAKRGGRFVLYLAGVISALGGAYLVVSQIFFPPK